MGCPQHGWVFELSRDNVGTRNIGTDRVYGAEHRLSGAVGRNDFSRLGTEEDLDILDSFINPLGYVICIQDFGCREG